MAGRSGWWFEEAVAGSTVDHPGGRTIGDADHVWLAWVTNNASDVHGNVDLAARSSFAGSVVLGALSVAIVLGLAAPAEPGSEVGLGRRQRGWSRITLVDAVRPGDTLRAFSRVHGTRLDGAHGGGYVRRTVVGWTGRAREVVRIDESVWVPLAERARTKDC